MKPKVKYSFIVCTYNRDKFIKETILHLIDQEFEKAQYEIVVINNNSADKTEYAIKEAIANHPDANIIYKTEKRQGLSFARNTGFEASKGEFLIFIDDDAFADKYYLKNLSVLIENSPDFKSGGGKIIPIFEEKKPRWMSRFLYPLVAATNISDRCNFFESGKFPLGANMFFTRDTLAHYGPFNVRLGRRGDNLEAGEEKDIFLRIRKDGHQLYYFPKVIVKHMIPNQRLTKEYIRKQAEGVGLSEKIRLENSRHIEKARKVLSEFIKVAATIILALFYFIMMKPAKGSMLVKFRIWVLKGYLKKYEI